MHRLLEIFFKQSHNAPTHVKFMILFSNAHHNIDEYLCAILVLPLLLTLTAYAATATTSCVSYGSSLALSLPLLLLLLSTPLSHLGLITAPHSTLVSLLCVWAASSALSA